MLKIVSFACILGVVLAVPKELKLGQLSAELFQQSAFDFYNLDHGERVESINEMVDTMLIEVRELMGEMGLDPLQLPDVHKNFSYKPIIITYHGELDLERGWAEDISEIYRNGDVKMDYGDHIVTVEVPIKFSQFLFNYDYNMKLMDLGPKGGVEGKVVDVEIFFSLSLDFSKLHVTLNKFDITHVGKINVKFTDNGIIDWLVNLMTGLVTGIFKGLVTTVAEIIVRNTLVDLVELVNSLLANLQPPQEGKLFEVAPSANLIEMLRSGNQN